MTALLPVDLYNETDAEPFARNVYLGDALGDDDFEISRAYGQLMRTGRYWIGGGGAPLILLMRKDKPR